MKILFLGDIVARSGRTVVLKELPSLRRDLKLDFVIANAENAAHGFGITDKICIQLYKAGVDVITGGNHSWDKPEIIPYIAQEQRLLRPLNYPEATPGRGVGTFKDGSGRKVKVVNIMTRLFMELLDDPFTALSRELPPGTPKSAGFEAIIVDIHGEATSEKMALGHFADGHASLVVGTHTHVPTADTQILVGGTGFHTDAGMCGDYDSVIGMHKEASIANFRRKFPRERLTPAVGEATLCGTYIETYPTTGLAARIEQVRLGGRLQRQLPEL